jgi:hypothetical protein
VVPTDAAGNVFTARPRSPSVLQRTGRAAGCNRVRAALCAAAGVAVSDADSLQSAATRGAITRFLKKQTRAQLDALALAHDIPLHTMA